MNVSLVQLPIVWEDKAANFTQVEALLERSNFGGLIVLPELFATGFTMNAQAIAEDEGGETDRFLSNLAKSKSAHVIGGVAYNNGSEPPTNCATIAGPNGDILSRYKKTHPFTLGDEHQHYSRGNRVITTSIDGVTVAPAVCYDLRFPELFRKGAQQGAQLFVVIANWPAKRNSHWITLLKARAIENQAYVIGVNRCGEDPNLTYSGSSMLIDYQGEVVADAGTEAGVVEAEIDLAILQEWRDGFPALRDRHENLLG